MILEKCTAARGKCKATEESFKKGDVRLAVCSKNHKAYYSLAGMGDAVRPIVEASDGEYSASDITGFLALSKEERAAVCAAIDVKVSASAKKRARRGSDVTVATRYELRRIKGTGGAGEAALSSGAVERRAAARAQREISEDGCGQHQPDRGVAHHADNELE